MFCQKQLIKAFLVLWLGNCIGSLHSMTPYGLGDHRWPGGFSSHLAYDKQFLKFQARSASQANLEKARQELIGLGFVIDDILDGAEFERKLAGKTETVKTKARKAYGDMLCAEKIVRMCTGSTAKLIFKSLAGDQTGDIDDSDIITIPDGIKNGIIARGSKALGDVLAVRIKDALEHVVGNACDGVIDSVVKIGSFVNNNLFHDGYQPFTVEKVKALRTFVKASLDDVERLLREGLRDSLKGYDMPPRPSAEQKQPLLQVSLITGESTAPTQAQEAPVAPINPYDPWRMLMMAYSDQFTRFVNEISLCIGYYQEDNMIVFYAEQIQQQLQNLCSLLVKAKTLPELDELFGSSKVLVLAIKQNVDRLFTGLEDLVRPRSSQKDLGLGGAYDLRGSAKEAPKRDNDLGLGDAWTGLR